MLLLASAEAVIAAATAAARAAATVETEPAVAAAVTGEASVATAAPHAQTARVSGASGSALEELLPCAIGSVASCWLTTAGYDAPLLCRPTRSTTLSAARTVPRRRASVHLGLTVKGDRLRLRPRSGQARYPPVRRRLIRPTRIDCASSYPDAREVRR